MVVQGGKGFVGAGLSAAVSGKRRRRRFNTKITKSTKNTKEDSGVDSFWGWLLPGKQRVGFCWGASRYGGAWEWGF
jgi:hypothetical protein